MKLNIKGNLEKGETYIAKPVEPKKYKLKKGQLLTNTLKNAYTKTS